MKKLILFQIFIFIIGFIVGKLDSLPHMASILLSASFVLTSFYFMKTINNNYRKWIFRGLIFCFLGDITLMNLVPGGLIGGMIFFGIAHVLFIISYMCEIKLHKRIYRNRTFILGIVFYYAFYILIWFFSIFPLNKGIIFTISSLIYGLLVVTMAATALALFISDKAYLLTAVGAGVFVISDSIISLSQSYYVPFYALLVKTTYYLALFGIIYAGYFDFLRTEKSNT